MQLQRTRAAEISALIQAIDNCEKAGNEKWLAIHTERLEKIQLPSGSGFDAGTTIDIEASLKHRDHKLIFNTSFHHMTEHGYYAGWTEHRVTVVATFYGFDIRVGGVNRNDIKDYIGDVFHRCLSELVDIVQTTVREATN